MKELDEFIAIRAKKSENTANTYRVAIEQFGSYIGKDYADCIKADFVSYVGFLAKQYKPASIQAKIAALYSFYQYLEFVEKIDHVPFNLKQFRAAGIMPSVEITKHPVAEIDEEEGVNEVKEIVSQAKNLRETAIIMVMASTGMRISEMCDLTLSSYENGEIYIGKAKRNSVRSVALDDAVNKMLKEYITKERVDGQYLFTDNYGRRLDRRTVSNRIAQMSERSIGKHITAHGLRRTCATYLSNEHVDPIVIQEQLGHKSPITTARYIQDAKNKRFKTTRGVTSKIW